MSKLKIILVEQGVTDVDTLSEICIILQRLRLKDNLSTGISNQQPDMVILDVHSPGSRYLDELYQIQKEHPIPIVIFSQDDTPGTIELAVKSGVSAYVVDSLQCPRLLPILQTAMARFNKIRALEQELAKTQQQLEQRKIIDRAKGILMQQRQINEQQAYQLIRKTAMDKNKTLGDIARGINDTADLLLL